MMRRLFPLLCCALFLAGCPGVRPLPEEATKKVYHEQAAGVSKADIRQRLLLYVTENYNSAKAVVQVNEPDLVSGNGRHRLSFYQLAFYPYLEFTFTVIPADGEYELRFIVKDLSTPSGGSIMENGGGYEEEIATFFAEEEARIKKAIAGQ